MSGENLKKKCFRMCGIFLVNGNPRVRNLSSKEEFSHTMRDTMPRNECSNVPMTAKQTRAVKMVRQWADLLCSAHESFNVEPTK